ncbi:MAG TPA: 2Fe-2S iron-sulfur cluster-binding protein [Stenomitos sp.]
MYSASDQVYSVTFVDPAQGSSTTIQVGSDENILESAEDQGIRLPASCYAGKCITCVGKVVSGSVEQDSVFLKPEEVADGFVLTCRAYARSNCVILTHQEHVLLGEEA